MKVHLVRSRSDKFTKCGRQVKGEKGYSTDPEDVECQTCLLQERRLAQAVVNRCAGRLLTLTGKIR